MSPSSGAGVRTELYMAGSLLLTSDIIQASKTDLQETRLLFWKGGGIGWVVKTG